MAPGTAADVGVSVPTWARSAFRIQPRGQRRPGGQLSIRAGCDRRRVHPEPTGLWEQPIPGQLRLALERATRPPTAARTSAPRRPESATQAAAGGLVLCYQDANEIDRALTALEDAGRLQRKDQVDRRGRPAEIWVPLSRAA